MPMPCTACESDSVVQVASARWQTMISYVVRRILRARIRAFRRSNAAFPWHLRSQGPVFLVKINLSPMSNSAVERLAI